jgi:Ca2+/Na+ antiporter
LENSLLIIFTFKMFYSSVRKVYRKSNYTIKAGFYIFIIGTCMFSLTMGNLGVMLRMKIMLMPCFTLLVCYLISMRKEING